jgi:transposase
LVGLEAEPMSEWLHAGLSRHGLETVRMEPRHVRAALKASLVKTDRRDACGIGQLLRLGWFRPIHVKTASAGERRVLLGARDTLVQRLRNLDNSVRGLLRRLPTAAPAAGALVLCPRNNVNIALCGDMLLPRQQEEQHGSAAQAGDRVDRD